MSHEKLRTQTDTFQWQPKIDGLRRDIPIQVVRLAGAESSERESLDSPDVIFLPGLGEGRLASKATVKKLGKEGLSAAALILPFHHLEPTVANIERTIVEAPIMFTQSLQEESGDNRPRILVGHSQGGGEVLITGSAAPEMYDVMASWSPVGLTSEFLGNNEDARRGEVVKRLLLKNAIKKDQSIVYPGNLVAGMGIAAQLLGDMSHKRFKPKLDYALAVNGVKLLDKVVRLKGADKVRVFGGENDPLFKYSEYLAALGAVGLQDILEQTPGSHSSPLAPAGKQQLGIVADWLKAAREPNH